MTEDELRSIEVRERNWGNPIPVSSQPLIIHDCIALLAEVRRLRRVTEGVQFTLIGADPEVGCDAETIVETLKDRLIAEPDGPSEEQGPETARIREPYSSDSSNEILANFPRSYGAPFAASSRISRWVGYLDRIWRVARDSDKEGLVRECHRFVARLAKEAGVPGPIRDYSVTRLPDFGSGYARLRVQAWGYRWYRFDVFRDGNVGPLLRESVPGATR